VHEAGDDLGVERQPARRSAREERLERGGQPVVGQHGRVDAPRELAQLAQRALDVLAGALELGAHRRPQVELPEGEAEAQRDRHEALLRAVVQVALDAPPLGVGGDDAPRARRPPPPTARRSPRRGRPPAP